MNFAGLAQISHYLRQCEDFLIIHYCSISLREAKYTTDNVDVIFSTMNPPIKAHGYVSMSSSARRDSLFFNDNSALTPKQNASNRCLFCTPDLDPSIYFGMTQLLDSARAGCRNCAILGECIEATPMATQRYSLSTRWGMLFAQLLGDLPNSTWIKLPKIYPMFWLNFYVVPEDVGTYDGCFVGNHISSSAGDDAVFEFAKTRLHQCMRDHRCSEGQTGAVPSRLLAVEPGSNRIRIVEVKGGDHQFYSQYACLSYHWGESQTKPREMLVIKEKCTMLKEKFIPETQIFRDAVVATLKLGLKYLWIDALCIIQDDVQDFDHETARMGDIFSNACVTIMAASAEDCNTSFLGRSIMREQARPFHCCKAADSFASSPPVWVRNGVLRIQQSQTSLYSRMGPMETECKIDSRGWVLQEYLRSPRILRFEPGGIIFKCCKYVWAEGGFREELSAAENTFGWKGLTANPHLGTQFFDLDLRREWVKVAEDISAREFTFKEDLFPAISGLAALYAQVSGTSEEYLAGLWKSWFIEGLHWTKSDQPPGAESASEPDIILEPDLPLRGYREPLCQYLAPSWSWASCSSPIVYLQNSAKDPPSEVIHFSKVIDAKCSLRDGNKFGQITAGHAIVEGPAQTMSPHRDLEYMTASVMDVNITDWLTEMLRSNPIRLDDERAEIPDQVEVLCLSKVKKLEDVSLGGNILTTWYFLVLNRSTTAKSSYERAGIWRLREDTSNPWTVSDGDTWLKAAETRQFRII